MSKYKANSKFPFPVRFDMENSAILIKTISSKLIGDDAGNMFSDYIWDNYITKSNQLRNTNAVKNFINKMNLSDSLKTDMIKMWDKYNCKIPNIDKYCKN